MFGTALFEQAGDPLRGVPEQRAAFRHDQRSATPGSGGGRSGGRGRRCRARRGACGCRRGSGRARSRRPALPSWRAVRLRRAESISPSSCSRSGDSSVEGGAATFNWGGEDLQVPQPADKEVFAGERERVATAGPAEQRLGGGRGRAWSSEEPRVCCCVCFLFNKHHWFRSVWDRFVICSRV